jgi:hypothetical protein
MSLSCVGNTSGLDFHFPSFCGHEELCALQGVSKQWYVLAGNDQAWRNAFERFFQEELHLKKGCKEAFKKRLNPVCLDDIVDLANVTKTFLCSLKWDRKRAFICSFPGSPYSITIEQGFGPARGTKEGFEVAPDEIECFQLEGKCQAAKSTAATYFDESFTQCPDIKSIRSLSFNAKGIPFSVRWNNVGPGSSGFLATHLPSKGYIYYSFSGLLAGYVNDCVKGVDVGYGNTLGYCSEINGWRSPFKLHCITGTSGNSIWVGLFPKDEVFKFVKIDSKGKLKWEQIEGNRRIFDSPFSGHCSLQESYTKLPIKF